MSRRLDLTGLQISGDGPDEFVALYRRMRTFPQSDWNGHMFALRDYLQVKAWTALVPTIADTVISFSIVVLVHDGTIVEHDVRALSTEHAQRIAIEREYKRGRVVVDILSVKPRD